MMEEVSYIAKRYERGKFSVDEGWRRLHIAPALRLRRMRIAAAVACIVVLSATAAVIYHEVHEPKPAVEVPQPVTPGPKEAVRVIDFENAELTAVIAKIKEVYGVEVINVPENASDYRLSLHFEGNPVELLETINDIIDTNMAVKE